MTASVAELVVELKALRKGRGLLAMRIGDRLGPALRVVCGIAAADEQAVMRRKATERLVGLSEGLPEDLRDVVRAALAIHDDVTHPYYQERIRWIAETLRRDDRTARRRVDEGIERLAELAAIPADEFTTTRRAAGEWHTEVARVSLALDLPAPEAFEFRRVVADRDGVAEIDLADAVGVDGGGFADPAALVVDVFHGGTLVRRGDTPPDRLPWALRLARPLRRHEAHEYAVRFRAPAGRAVEPHYVCVPRRRWDTFDLTVRFGPGARQRDAWRLTDVFQRDVDDPFVPGERLPVDRAGEARTTFHRLTPGLAYGVRWNDP